MASKSNGVDNMEWSRMPQSGSCWDKFVRSIYNHEEKSFLGRTAKRWGIVIVFYAVFYAVLAAMFSICMAGLWLSIDTKRPTYILQESLIGSSPGVAFRPYPAVSDNPQAVDEYKWFIHREDNKTQEDFQRRLEKFLKNYGFEQSTCSRSDSFGLPDTPCFIVKLNKLIGWSPDYYDAAELPDDMPEDLREHIKSLEVSKRQQIWISCVDEEANNSTVVEYPWGRGLSGHITAIKIRPPENHLTKVRCRLWAKNIRYNGSMKDTLAAGYTRIQVMIESNPIENKEQ